MRLSLDIAKMNREDPKTPDSAIPAIEIMATAAAKSPRFVPPTFTANVWIGALSGLSVPIPSSLGSSIPSRK